MIETKKMPFFALPLLLIGCVFLRLINLDKGFSGDEGALLFYATGTIAEIMTKLKEISIFPPISALLLHIWMLFGNSELWIRLYFVLFGAGSCYLIYLIGVEYLDRKFGLIALFVSTISPFLIWTSQYIRSYIDSTFWMLLSTLFFLKLIKSKEGFRNYLFYALSSAVAVYTSYFNILILLTQFVFVLIFFYRERRRLLGYLLSVSMAGILFLPWFLTALGQYRNATGIKQFWNLQGFRLGGIYIGRYIRQVLTLFGIDPDFLNMGLSQIPINRWLLFFISFVIFIAVLWVIYLAVKALYKIQVGRHKLVWFFVILAVLPIVLANLAEALFNFRPTPKLFSYNCAIFIFLIAALLYVLSDRRKIYYPVLLGITFLYIARLPAAYQPEMDTKKAYNFLANNISEGEIILMVRNTNYYLGAKPLPNVTLKDYLEQDVKTGDYIALSGSAKDVLSGLKNTHTSIWFYKSEGTDEILGANRLLLKWLNENGYSVQRVKHFKRIELLNFKKNGA